MFITSHAAAGAIVGELLPVHPILAFVVAIVVHLAMDIVPHGDTGLYKGYISGSGVKRAVAFVTIDAIAAVVLVLVLFTWHGGVEPETAVAAGVAGGLLPDFLVAMYEMTHSKFLHWAYKAHFFFHNMISGRYGDISLGSGLGVEFATLGLLLSKLF